MVVGYWQKYLFDYCYIKEILSIISMEGSVFEKLEFLEEGKYTIGEMFKGIFEVRKIQTPFSLT